MNQSPSISAFNSGFKTGKNMIRLHLNESPYELPGEIKQQINGILSAKLTLYPDSECAELRELIARHIGVSKDMIAVGNGVDEIILLTTLTLADRDSTVVFSDTTFPGYRSAAQVAGAKTRAVALKNFTLDTQALIQAMDAQTKIAFICNPLNPTGSLLDPGDVAKITQAAEATETVPVFDEAYMDYVSNEQDHSALSQVKQGREAIVLRTFSKAWELASIRIGFAVGPPRLIGKIWNNRNALPFNINRLAQSILPVILEHKDYLRTVRADNAATKSLLYDNLDRMGVEYLPSATNFVMVSAQGDSTDLAGRLAENHDILVRDLSLFGIPGWLRVTLGFPSDIDGFCDALASELPSNSARMGYRRDLPHWERSVPAMKTGSAAQLFNGFTASHVLQSLSRLGVWDAIDNGVTSIEELCILTRTPPHILNGLLRTAALFGAVTWNRKKVRLTEFGKTLMAEMGYFTWAVGGYGDLLQDLSETGENSDVNSVPSVIRRNGELIAKGAGAVGASRMLPIEQRFFEKLEFAKIADIGCGDGSRLVRLLAGRPGSKGLGIDINEKACAYARKCIASQGYDDRIEIVRDDISDQAVRIEHPDVDAVCCFLMLHDIFEKADDHASALIDLRNKFPNARYFVFADTMLHDWSSIDGSPPIFSMHFELVHALMKTPLYSLDHYLQVFAAAGFRLINHQPFGAPSTWIFLLEPERALASG